MIIDFLLVSGNGREEFNKIKMWRLWAKALGEKSGKDNGEADKIACIRTIIVLIYVITNLVLIANVIHHW